MENRSPSPLGAGTVIADRYELESVLGQGGFGTVYKARQRVTGQWVALKVLRPTADQGDRREARFEREMQLTARLNHPHVIRLLDSGLHDTAHRYIVFEYVDGADLTEVLRAEGPLSPTETKRLLLQVLDGLSAAHALGMVHRDVKPRNIMISRTGLARNAQLLDFGIAAVVADSRYAEYASITQGEVLSTPAYAAPEMLRGEQLTPQSDLYAWGLVFLECLLGRPVVEGASIAEIILKQVSNRPVAIPESIAGHPLGAILRRVTAKSLDERATTSEVFAALEACDVADLSRAWARGAIEAEERPHGALAATSLIHTDVASSSSGSLSRSPMVGRDRELGLLLDRWEQVKEGQGQVALISGEAGIGKSRFIQELKRQVSGDGHEWIECRCAPEEQTSALGLIIELLGGWLELSPTALPDARLDALEGLLRAHGLSLPESIPLLARLLSLPFEARYAKLPLSPQGHRKKTLETIAALIAARAGRRPVAFVIEDLHWADPSLLDLIALLIPHADGADLLVLLTARPSFDPPWSGTDLLQIRLKPLTAEQGTRLLDQAARGARLPPGLREQMILKASGVPLFLEELTRMVVERAAVTSDGATDLAIPDTLRESLNARLSRLGPARETAQLASALGREFSHDLLRAVSPLDDRAFEATLARLCGAELLHRRGIARAARYTFKHRLIQDAAYDSMAVGARQALHRTIARVLTELDGALEPPRPEILAHHHAEGGQHAQAVAQVLKAGQLALQRSANQEAIAHVQKGIQWTRAHTPGREQATQELALQSVLLPALFATRGYAAPEVEQALARARALSEEVGDTLHAFTINWGLWVCYTCQGRHVEALKIARELLPVAERARSSDWILEAHAAIGHSLYYFPQLVEGTRQMESALAIYDFEAHRGHAATYGQDPAVLTASFLGIIHWLRGYPERALEVHRQGLAAATMAAHPYSSSFLQGARAIHHQLRQEPDEAHAIAGVLIEQATLHVYPFWAAIAQIIQGWASVARGGRSLDQVRAGIASFRRTGARNGLPYYLMLLAESEAAILGPGPALVTLDEAAKVIEQTEERRMEADLHRLRGLTLLARSLESTGEAEACFHRAISVSRAQGARSLELRATLSLARLWQRAGRAAEAKSVLGAIHGWFTEGQDAPDHRAARQLLAQL
jgi:serine/threonine protein kinase/predicted ATPase